MSEPIVQVEEGKLRGKISVDYKGGQFYSFQGIPYAKPPVGDLRFKVSAKFVNYLNFETKINRLLFFFLYMYRL